MVIGIITILLGVLPFIMFTQPFLWAYTGEGAKGLNAIYKLTSCYDAISFKEGETMLNIGVGCMIASLVFAGIMILLTLLNMIGRASGNAKILVGAKIAAFLFFLTTLASVILIGIYVSQEVFIQDKTDFLQSTVGYGLIVSLVGAFLSVFFAPSKRKLIEKQ